VEIGVPGANAMTTTAVLHWDLENQCIPKGTSVPALCTMILDVVRKHYPHVLDLFCYYVSSHMTHPVKELSMMGFDTIDCIDGKANAVDRRIIVRALKPSPSGVARPAIVIITGDGDYAYALSALRNAEIPTLLIYNKDNMKHVNTTLVEIAPCSIGISFSGRDDDEVNDDDQQLSDGELEEDETASVDSIPVHDRDLLFLAIDRTPETQDGWRLERQVFRLFMKLKPGVKKKHYYNVRKLLRKNRLIELDKLWNPYTIRRCSQN
jgi:hypothetical protein